MTSHPSLPADAVSPSRQRRRAHALALLAVVSALGAVVVSNLADDPRPLDVQLSGALGQANESLTSWQDQLSHGLQVSMLAVADAHVLPEASPVDAREVAASAPGPAAQVQ